MEPVLYTLGRGGEGIGGGRSTATEDSLWKMEQPPSRGGDVIRVEHRTPTPPPYVCARLRWESYERTRSHTHLPHAASPSGRPQLYRGDVTS